MSGFLLGPAMMHGGSRSANAATVSLEMPLHCRWHRAALVRSGRFSLQHGLKHSVYRAMARRYLRLRESPTESTLKAGVKNWYVVAADYGFGHALEREITQIVNASGGKMLGSVRHPVGTSDFASHILSAQNSGAHLVALTNAGDDMVKALKAAEEFGLLTSMMAPSRVATFDMPRQATLTTTRGGKRLGTSGRHRA
jgi:ABC-type branched-subunit amino acid transport system substrate-binding protein